MNNTIYIAIIDGKPGSRAYTSLTGICKDTGIGYSAASKGKRKFIKAGTFIELHQIELTKAKPRGKNTKKYIIR